MNAIMQKKNKIENLYYSIMSMICPVSHVPCESEVNTWQIIYNVCFHSVNSRFVERAQIPHKHIVT